MSMTRPAKTLVAAGVTFYGLLALFPATAALVSLRGDVVDHVRATRQNVEPAASSSTRSSWIAW